MRLSRFISWQRAVLPSLACAACKGGVFQWVRDPPGYVAPAGSNRSGHGVNEAAEASAWKRSDSAASEAPGIQVFGTIVLKGHIAGKKERRIKSYALYYAFITKKMMGYGDSSSEERLSKTLAIVIALVGIIFTGLVVAVGLHASMHAFDATHDISQVLEQIKQ